MEDSSTISIPAILSVFALAGSFIAFTGIYVARREKQQEKEGLEDKNKFVLYVQYHSQGLSQSNLSFYVSLFAAALGFGAILWSIYLASKAKQITEAAPVLTSVSGIILEAVSALFFTQSNNSRKLMASFFEKLGESMNVDDAKKMADKIGDKSVQDKAHLLLSLHFANIKLTESNLLTVLDAVVSTHKASTPPAIASSSADKAAIEPEKEQPAKEA